jgi:mono/diheme cytochrome c family protein
MFRIRLLILFSSSVGLLVGGGCGRTEKKVEFEPNFVFAKATEINLGYPMDQALREAQVALTEHFGTPDEPKIPEFVDDDLKKLVNQENLIKSAGPPEAGRGLYRKHCISCHGVTGNGRGLNAMQADVYPRDFRAGKFKFKSTARGTKPTKADLFHSIRNGIAATPMQVIKELSDDDVDALVDYVIYLSWRGEAERLMLTAAEEIEFKTEESGTEATTSKEEEDDDTIRNLYAPGTKGFEEQVKLVEEIVSEVGSKWTNASSGVKEAADPGDIPVKATLDELIAAANSTTDSPLKASIERGKELYKSDAASCSKCHGALGAGDGQTQDYDDWTKDWTLSKGISPTDEEALIPLLARGGLPPKKIIPRDFRQGVYRGGGDPEKLFVRISQGIEGTPMPGVESSVQPPDIWHLVNYVRSLAVPPKEEVASK